MSEMESERLQYERKLKSTKVSEADENISANSTFYSLFSALKHAPSLGLSRALA